jgi:hypothetical protein
MARELLLLRRVHAMPESLREAQHLN